MAVEIKFVGGSMDGRIRRARSLCNVSSVHSVLWRKIDQGTGAVLDETRERYRLDRERRE